MCLPNNKNMEKTKESPETGDKPTKEEISAVTDTILGCMAQRFEENQKKPFQYVVAYYDKNDNFLGYHDSTFCTLTQKKEQGKRYSGENPYNQLAIIRKNLDYTLNMTEEKTEGKIFAKLNLQTKEQHFPNLGVEDVFIEAEYLEEGIAPQRFVWKEITTDD